MNNLLRILGIAYLALSSLCYSVYALDKRAAKLGGRRVPEATLLTLGLIGGWPGGLLAQRQLRHKLRKPSFQLAFWATALTNVVAALALAACVATS